uniref:dTMP kinase n=1 Tax=Heterorhabditis bacteriophora TaxID=37862 RepID=A0A1I7WV54_HETBA
MSRGALIVFEGLDRSGKSTQAKLLRDHIRKSGRDAEIIRFPGMSLYLSNVPFFYLFLIHFLLNKWDLYRNITCLLDRLDSTGQLIDQYLKGEVDFSEQALHLLFSANRWQKAAEIKNKIGKGVDVICDRYFISGIAYSLAKGLNEHWVRQSDVGLPLPDLVFFFKLSPEEAMNRTGFGEERLETEPMQRKVAEAMTTLKQSYWREVDANNDPHSVENVVQELYAAISREHPLGVVE